MASLRILVPDATINYVKNPSVRYDTTGYVAVGSAITRVLTQARFGISSLQIVTNGSALYEGASYRVNWLSGLQGPLTGSVYLRGTGVVRLRLENSNGTWLSKSTRLITTRWTRVNVVGRQFGGDDTRLYVETDKSVQAATFYADGFQVELKPYPTTYCDGDQEDCTWNILEHGSLSTRTVYTRAGGRWVDIIGCDRDEKDLYMTVLGGLGTVPIRNNIQPYALQPGSYFQNVKAENRVITLSFNAINPDLTGRKGKSLQKLHALRGMLFNLIQPDRTAGNQEFEIEYQDGEIPVYCKVRYDGGLEGEWDLRNHFRNSFPVRLLAVNPYLRDDNRNVSSIAFRERATVNYAMQRLNGVWTEMNGGLSDVINEMAIGKKGEVYACGSFIRANNKTTATDPQIYANYIAYWDGTQWQRLSTGANGVINSIAVAPNGDIYVTGNFTVIGGVSCARIAKWNGTTWSPLDTGLANGAGLSVKVAPNGDVYVGGTFTQAGSVAAYYVARFDGSSWHNLGLYLGMNNAVYAIAISSDGTQVYLGGAFTDEYSSPAIDAGLYAALYTVSNNQFSSLGDGFDGLVRRMVLSPTGRLYACGDFTASGSQEMLYISYWNGAAWYGLGAGANDTVRDMDITVGGNIIAVGDFTRIGAVDANYVAMWNGSTWVAMDVYVTAACYAVKMDANENIFLGIGGTLADYASTTIVTNTGTAEAYPELYIIGPCTLVWFENQTAGKRVYADMAILNGEEVTLEFATGKVTSSVRGDLAYSLSPSSDFHSWSLFPKDNKIQAMLINEVGAQMWLSYAPRHWSADATHRELDL